MDIDQWRQIEEVYHGALNQNDEQLVHFLDEACRGNQSLRCEVEALLAQEHAAGVIDEPIWIRQDDLMVDWDAARTESTVLRSQETGLGEGSTLGHYRIRRLVGSGGMGAVYEAEQEKPRRTVALKVIRPGLANQDVLRRFELE